MIRQINAKETLLPNSEIHYAILSAIDESQYPQVHDFFEITFITSGKLDFIINNKSYPLSKGQFILVRPGEVHTKKHLGHCTHINLAFPREVLEAMLDYLYPPAIKDEFFQSSHINIVSLQPSEQKLLQSKLERIHLFPYDDPQASSYLRMQLIDLFARFVLPINTNPHLKSCEGAPTWFQTMLLQLDHTENLAKGMDFLIEHSGKSKEHISRLFQKHLHTTPTSYINALRLNYVANMLEHSDYDIIDLVLEMNFQSLSYFYSIFKAEYGTTPKKFRQASRYKS